MPDFIPAINSDHSFRVNAMANAYDVREREELRRRKAMRLKTFVSDDPALILMKELLENIKKAMGDTVLTKTSGKTFESMMQKIKEKNENSETQNNYLVRNRIRSTIIFAGPSTELEEHANKIRKILKTDSRIRDVDIKYDLTKKGYKDIKLYFSAQGVKDIELERPIVNKYTDMTATGRLHKDQTVGLHKDQTVGKELRVHGKKQWIAEAYEIIVILANATMAKDGPKKLSK